MMYGDYIKERLGHGIIERDEGFATYEFIDSHGVKCVYIRDIYVRPDFRRTSIASDMADAVVTIAIEAGCKRLIGTVVPSAKGSTNSLKVLLGYGMSLHSCGNDLIVFKKEI